MAKIPIKVYEEVKITSDNVRSFTWYVLGLLHDDIEWVDNNGTNTPYFVTIVNKDIE